MPSPRSCLARIAGWLTEWSCPRFPGGASGIEHRRGTRLDQLAPFIERMPNIVGHRTIS